MVSSSSAIATSRAPARMSPSRSALINRERADWCSAPSRKGGWTAGPTLPTPDGTLLALTDSGRQQLDRTHCFRQEIFAREMADWPDADRSEFARLITAFVISFAQVVPEAE